MRRFYLFPSDYIPLGLTKPMPYNKSFHIRKVSHLECAFNSCFCLLFDSVFLLLLYTAACGFFLHYQSEALRAQVCLRVYDPLCVGVCLVLCMDLVGLQVCEQFGVTKEEVLLIDDDVNNCAAFVADGGVALRVGGEQGFDLTQLEVM